jgi:hypothetical protein
MKTITRLVLATTAGVAVLYSNVTPSSAYGDRPWCAVVSVGAGGGVWDCRYRSIEECRPNVVAGNRGFCNWNPWYGRYGAGPGKHPK